MGVDDEGWLLDLFKAASSPSEYTVAGGVISASFLHLALLIKNSLLITFDLPLVIRLA